MGERGEISRRARFLAGQVCVPRVRVPRCGPSDHDRRGLPARLKSQPHFKSPSATSSRSLSPTHAMPPAAGPAPSSDDNGSEQPASCLTCKRTSGGIVAAAGIWGLAQVRRNQTKPNQTRPDFVDADARSLSRWSSFSRMQAQFDSSIDRGSKRWMRVLGAGLLFAGVWYGFVTSYAIPPHRKPKH